MTQARTFNTLEEIFEATKGSQFTAQQFINRRANIDGVWQDFEVSNDLRLKISNEIADLYGGHLKTRFAVEFSLNSCRPQHWGLSRTILEKYGDSPARFSYCAGQDYTSELASIRKALK
jgi:hypothetical protein